MTGLSRREKRAAKKKAKKQRKAAKWARLSGKPDSDTDHGRTSR